MSRKPEPAYVLRTGRLGLRRYSGPFRLSSTTEAQRSAKRLHERA